LTVAVNATDFSSAAFLSSKNKTVNFSALVSASLKFSVKTVNLKSAGPISPPDCYRFDIQVKICSVAFGLPINEMNQFTD
jgi:hypothetical protein